VKGRFAVSLLAGVLLAGGALAQDRAATLADIRQELTVLHVEMQRLRRELNTTSGPTFQMPNAPFMDRLDALESELRKLTARTEALEGRIARIVEDGTRRIGDLEFRLVELEGGDVSQLGETTTLGGDVPGEGLPSPGGTAPAEDGAPELAVAEQDAFDAAMDAYEAGELDEAAAGFAAFTETYPGGALSGAAHFWRGRALAESDDWRRAARAFLDSFSAAPDGEHAPEALWRLGLSLDRIGQREEACLTLAEVAPRFPDSPAAEQAEAEMRALGCP